MNQVSVLNSRVIFGIQQKVCAAAVGLSNGPETVEVKVVVLNVYH